VFALAFLGIGHVTRSAISDLGRARGPWCPGPGPRAAATQNSAPSLVSPAAVPAVPAAMGYAPRRAENREAVWHLLQQQQQCPLATRSKPEQTYNKAP
jgi:hypothetical protein